LYLLAPQYRKFVYFIRDLLFYIDPVADDATLDEPGLDVEQADVVAVSPLQKS
jgi:hypothetical protein